MYIYFSDIEHNAKLNFSLETHLTHINTIFEYCHASVILDNVDVLYLEEENLCRLKLFFLKKTL